MRRLALVAFLSTGQVMGHIALWDPSLFGQNYPGQSTDAEQHYDTNAAVHPLRAMDNLSKGQWFAHGFKDYPPPPGVFMVLESGGLYRGELACNRQFTRMRDPKLTAPQPQLACEEDTGGAMHTTNRKGEPLNPALVSGTALAMAYTSDQSALKPSDMTVISVNHNSVWLREIVYAIPKGLPECPAGGCLCTWNWIHQAHKGEGYDEEIYNNLYRCTITGQTDNSNAVLPGQIPVMCEGDQAKCIKGPKQPVYLYQKDDNNIQSAGLKDPPSYDARYGFTDGAQDTAIGRKGLSNDVRRWVKESFQILFRPQNSEGTDGT